MAFLLLVLYPVLPVTEIPIAFDLPQRVSLHVPATFPDEQKYHLSFEPKAMIRMISLPELFPPLRSRMYANIGFLDSFGPWYLVFDHYIQLSTTAYSLRIAYDPLHPLDDHNIQLTHSL